MIRTITKRAAIAASIVMMLSAVAACSFKRTTEALSAADSAETLAVVGTSVLTLDDMRRALPVNLSPVDSANFVAAYVKTWVSDKLITEVALEKIGSYDEIERLTEEYRRNLIMWKYRELAVRADSSLHISEADVRQYYADHASAMKLRQPQLKGIYIKIESNAPAIAKVKKLYKSTLQKDIEELEKVGLYGAIHYDYFRDEWVPWEQIITKIPAEISASQLRKGYTFELEHDGFTYLLSVSDVLPVGAVMPYESAAPLIRETLEATRLTELDALLRMRLYDQAVAEGKVIINISE
ncbi:MAG: peptidyl-prolyl cis-trans isomerase [Bacteroidales bacterium]|nr:peptidyl-prolyl cis-trans isomerase [Bacteroidales bacterium]